MTDRQAGEYEREARKLLSNPIMDNLQDSPGAITYVAEFLAQRDQEHARLWQTELAKVGVFDATPESTAEFIIEASNIVGQRNEKIESLQARYEKLVRAAKGLDMWHRNVPNVGLLVSDEAQHFLDTVLSALRSALSDGETKSAATSEGKG